MSHLDHLFGDGFEQDENNGEIYSDNENGNDGNDGQAGDDDDDDNQGSAPVKVEPKKRIVRNPRNVLNVAKLKGPRGIVDIDSYFKGFKFHGKGYERVDLDAMMKKLEHWAHRLYPKFSFDDCLATIENLGKKKELQSHLNKYRMDMLEPEPEERKLDDGDSDDGLAYGGTGLLNQPLDPLDSMLEEQIAISRGHLADTSGVALLSGDVADRTFDALKGADTGPEDEPGPSQSEVLSADVRAQIAANRLKALEIRQRRLAQQSEQSKPMEEDGDEG